MALSLRAAPEVEIFPARSEPVSAEPRSPLERQYAISLVEREDKEKTEIAINLEGIRVLLNLDTSNLLSGATVDWGGEGFSVDARPTYNQQYSNMSG